MKRFGSITLLLLRVVIGWHFLYEGISKVVNPEWSGEAYLRGSYGFLSGFFHSLTGSPTLLAAVDFLNIWGLILIGTGLFLGIFIRISAISGIVLLSLYYFAYPPFGQSLMAGVAEGHYWLVNRNLIEILALIVVCLMPAKEFSLQNLFHLVGSKKPAPGNPGAMEEKTDAASVKRRELLKGLVTLPFFGGVVYAAAAREANAEPDILSGATIAMKKFDLRDLKGEMPKGKIGDLEMSRLILGCNLIGGWSHSRDLAYVGTLFRHYNTESKIFETLSLCEQAGIDTTNMVVNYFQLFNKYRQITGSKMKSICQAHVLLEGAEDPLLEFKQARDFGTTSMYVQGASSDTLVQNQQMDLIQEAVEFMRSQGMLAGIGAHSIQVPIACEKAGIKPDYYFKTMHHDRYWSAHPREFREEFSVDHEKFLDHNKFHDNLFDVFPEQTIEVFHQMDVPLIGFKVLAAGAITPEDGFRYAFENGADFICVGMFDFQVVENVNTTIDILNSELKRARPWHA